MLRRLILFILLALVGLAAQAEPGRRDPNAGKEKRDDKTARSEKLEPGREAQRAGRDDDRQASSLGRDVANDNRSRTAYEVTKHEGIVAENKARIEAGDLDRVAVERDMTSAEKEIVRAEMLNPEKPMTLEGSVDRLAKLRARLEPAAHIIDEGFAAEKSGYTKTTSGLDELAKILRSKQHQNNTVYDRALEQNVEKFGEMASALRTFRPDRIFAMETGGMVCGEVLKALEPGFDVLEMMKDAPGKDVQARQIGAAIEEAINKEGKTRFAIVDYDFGGQTRDLMNTMAAELIARYSADRHLKIEIETHWIRETTGREHTLSTGSPSSGGKASSVTTHEYRVAFAVGEDQKWLRSAETDRSVRVFDAKGRVTRVFEPDRGESTRNVLVKLLAGLLVP